MAEPDPGTWAGKVRGGDLHDPRAAALWVVERTLASKQPADSFLRRVEGRLDSRDRALCHRLVTDVLRWLLRLDDVIEQASGRAIGKVDRQLLGPLRLGAAQVLWLERVPAHAAVSTAVDLARTRTEAGARFVNAVLRKVAAADGLADFPVRADDPVERLAIETSHSRFLVDRWSRQFGGERTRRLLEANNRDRPASILSLGGATSRDGLLRRLATEGVTARYSDLSPVGLLIEQGRPLETDCFREGRLYPQDEGSQCVALIPPPRPAERILDAAASPGGKTLSTLAWEPSARVIAADASVRRLKRLRANHERFGRGFSMLVADARRPALGAGFDRVIADLPCSGSGTIRKHPELKWRIDAEQMERLGAEGREILDGLAPLVGGGGYLVIATCSLEPEENEVQVGNFIDRHPDFEPVDLEGLVPKGMAAHVEAVGRWRLVPAADHDGFTVHLLRRRGSKV